MGHSGQYARAGARGISTESVDNSVAYLWGDAAERETTGAGHNW